MAESRTRAVHHSRTASQAYHCPTCLCKEGQSTMESRFSKPVNSIPINSRNNNPLFESRLVGVVGENISKDKITWFKSVSPKPRNIVFRYVSPPKVLTRSFIRESRLKESNPEVMETPMKKIFREQQAREEFGLDSMLKARNVRESEYEEEYEE